MVMMMSSESQSISPSESPSPSSGVIPRMPTMSLSSFMNCPPSIDRDPMGKLSNRYFQSWILNPTDIAVKLPKLPIVRIESSKRTRAFGVVNVISLEPDDEVKKHFQMLDFIIGMNLRRRRVRYCPLISKYSNRSRIQICIPDALWKAKLSGVEIGQELQAYISFRGRIDAVSCGAEMICHNAVV